MGNKNITWEQAIEQDWKKEKNGNLVGYMKLKNKNHKITSIEIVNAIMKN